MSSTESARDRYQRDLNWLWGAVHELPAGVLWGANAATAAQCAEMMTGLQAFASVCARLGLAQDHARFIEDCRWHFEHYPHYLERRHFVDYATYVRDRNGPLTVQLPTEPRP